MWYRDRALAEIRVAELTRDAAAHRLAMDAGPRRSSAGIRRQARVLTASMIRFAGRAALAVAERIDTCTAEAEQAGGAPEMAYHRS